MARTTFMLYFILLIALSSAQFLPTPIYQHAAGGGVALATSATGGPSACGARLVVLRNSTAAGTQCLARMNLTGGAVDAGEQCAAAFAGASAVSCLGVACYVLNPALKTVVAVVNGVLTTVSIGAMTNPNPTAFSAYQRNGNFSELYLVDSATDSIWQFTVSYPTATSVTPKTLVGITLPNPAGLFMADASTLLYASKSATQISRYNVLTDAPGALWSPTFNNIQLISRDTYGNVHVYDAVGSLLVIVPYATGITQTSFTVSGGPRSISENRNKIFIIDNTGITKYEDAFKLTTSFTSAKCMSIGGSITASISGGDYPMVIDVQPDFANVVANVSGNYTQSIYEDTPPSYPVTVLDEYSMRQIYVTGSALPAGRGWVNTTAHTGNMSYMFTFTQTNPAAPASSLSLSCLSFACISSSFFEWLEFWINIGDGGQQFKIAIGAAETIVNMAAIPHNTWYQFRFHFPTLTAQRGNYLRNPKANTFDGFQITDMLRVNGQNPIYIDTVRLIPYQTSYPTRLVYVFDACFNYQVAEVPFVNETFVVNVDSTSISCAANTTISKNLTLDGTLIADTDFGQGPFSYNWSYTTENASTVSGYPEMTSYITIYDNSLNKSWVDISISDNYALNSTKYYRSAPSSIEFTATDEGQGLIFQISPEIDMSDYRAIEFWVNGGDIGGQTFDLSIYRSTQVFPNNGGSIILFTNGYTEIPAKQWVKVTYTIPTGGTVFKYNVISLLSRTPATPTNGPSQPIKQPTMYIDDMVLIGKNVLTVTDNFGCKASTPRARVMAPPLLTQTVTISNVKCFNSSDGSVLAAMNGGAPPYTFSWSESDGDDDAILTGLRESIVSVNASDANLCQFKQYTAPVLQPPPIQLNYTIAQPLCFGSKGQISATATGGSGSYTYSWPPGLRVLPEPAPDAIFLDSVAPGFSLTNMAQLCAGTGTHMQLNYMPSHAGYCSLQPQFSTLAAEASIGGCAMCLSMRKYEGLIFWIYANSSAALQSLSIAFTKGNLKGAATPLSSLAPLSPNSWNKVSLNLSQVNETSPDGFVLISSTPSAMGTVLIDDVVVVPIAANGAGYSAYPGFTSIVEAAFGSYFLTLVDGNGCSFGVPIDVTQPDVIDINYNSTVSSEGGSDGSVVVEVSGGFPPYTYLWVELNQTTQNLTNVAYGQYTLRVTDANGCPMEVSVLVGYTDGPAEIRKYNSTLSGGLAALVSVGLIICLFSLIMLARYWAQFSTLGSFLSSMMVMGCLTSFLSALVLLPEPTDALCTAFPWLLGVGFVLVYGCLFIKTWALYQVWRKAIHYQRAALTPGYIMRCLGLALLVEIIFLIIWTVVEPPKVKLVKVVNNSYERQCDADSVTFWVIFLAGKGVWLIFGAVLSILTRNVAKEYNESSSIAYAIYNNILLGAIAIPLAILIKEVPGGRLTVEVVIISIAFSFTMVVVFFKIWHVILLPDKINLSKMESGGSKRSKGSRNSKNTNSSGSGSGGATRTTAKDSGSKVSASVDSASASAT